LDYTDNEAGWSLTPVSESKIKGTVTKVGTGFNVNQNPQIKCHQTQHCLK